jgi:hypothetical protein
MQMVVENIGENIATLYEMYYRLHLTVFKIEPKPQTSIGNMANQ